MFGSFDFNQEGKMQNKFKRHLIALAVASTLGGAPTLASAAGFALIEQSASGMGNAFAGAAATAEDASTIFFNPAGMTLLPDKQAVISGHVIKPTAKFSNNGSTTSPALITNVGGNGGDAGEWAIVPNAYFAMKITDDLRAGIGVTVPFGLKTEYDDGWAGRFQALKSEVKTIDINPSLAYRINDKISVGGGVSYRTIDAELSNAVDFSAVIFAGSGALIAIPNVEGKATVSGDDSAWGWNLGTLINLSPDTRVGIAYRSKVKFTLEGDVKFDRPVTGSAGANAIINGFGKDGNVTADIELPDIASISFLHRLNDRWDVMADYTWTGWSSFKKLTVVRSNGTTLTETNENWKDTSRYSIGASYRWSDTLKLRGGIAYDQTPVPDQYRTARIPDNDRTWVALGAQWKLTNSSALDFGYAHLFISDPSINQNGGNAPANGTLAGTYSGSVDILSAQYTLSF